MNEINNPASRDRVEIEITPEMVEAGMRYLDLHLGERNILCEPRLAELFRAMIDVAASIRVPVAEVHREGVKDISQDRSVFVDGCRCNGGRLWFSI